MTTPIVKTIVKTFEILEVFEREDRELTVNDIVVATGINHATAHRFLLTLAQIGILYKSNRSQYTLGLRLSELGSYVEEKNILAKAVMPYLIKLTDTYGEATRAGILDGENVVCIARVLAHHSLGVASNVGMRSTVYHSAMGKVLLSDLNNTELLRILNRATLKARTRYTLTDPDKLLTQIKTVRRQGYAINNQESEIGLRTIASPIKNQGEEIIAAFSVSGPIGRMTTSTMNLMLKDMQQHASELQGILYCK